MLIHMSNATFNSRLYRNGTDSKKIGGANKAGRQNEAYDMQHKSSNQLLEYWDTVRNGRFAPNRFEIEPAKISGILADVFILECADISTYRFRLAGTRVCTSLGHELRNCNLLDYFSGDDVQSIQNLLHNVVKDGAGAVMEFECTNGDRERAVFEMLVLPLMHSDSKVSRVLGSMAALTQPYWVGTIELRRMKLTSFDLIWPNGVVAPVETLEPPVLRSQAQTGDPRRRFRVLEGGLSNRNN